MSNVTQQDTPVTGQKPTESEGKPQKRAKAAQRGTTTKGPKKGKQAAKAAKKAADKAAGARTNKKLEVMALMRRPRGATLAEIVAASGWQKHTVRGFVSILGKKGEAKIESSKNSGGERVYKIAK